ncbi:MULTISPECIES: cation:dicarboxylase symporter family transporter [unclassified Luteimonas]|uniref:dicarboxylate/amino acid:cation symporter n=1 Tax=unclassified Luteimonas TaxID=2629088 RepID=UPI0031B81CD0
MKRMSTAARVLLALVLGAVVGLALAFHDSALAANVADAVQPVGRLWLNALQMTVVPLVAALVVLGVNTAADAAASGRTARRAMLVFAVLLIASGTFTAVMAPTLLSLVPRDASLVEAFRAAIGSEATQPGRAASFGEWIATVIPNNALAAAAANAMLPLVVFSLFFGFAATRILPERRAQLLALVQSIADTMIVIVRWVLWAAPVGVFALVLAVCARVGAGVLGALGWYVLLLCTLYIMVTVLLYLVAALVAREPVRRFAAGIAPAQAIAASTQSSLASLPAMVDCARERLGYPLHVTSLVLPMAVSLFRITSPVQYIGVVSFIAWMYGIELGGVQVGTAIVLSALISMGSVGLPGQVSFMTNNLPVTQAMGLPVEPLALLLAVDNIPDVFSTVGNVTGDLTATSIVARQDG